MSENQQVLVRCDTPECRKAIAVGRPDDLYRLEKANWLRISVTIDSKTRQRDLCPTHAEEYRAVIGCPKPEPQLGSIFTIFPSTQGGAGDIMSKMFGNTIGTK